MKTISLLLGVAYLATVICCVVDILKTRRGSSSAAFWLLAITVVPLGFVFYIVLSESEVDQEPPAPE